MTAGWVRPLYYYLVMLVSLFFFVIALFNIARVYYITNFAPRLVETEVRYLIPYNENRCEDRYENTPNDGKTEPKTIPADKEKCKEQVADYKDLWIQQNASWAIIAMVLSSVVMLVHYFVIGRRLGDKKVVPNTNTTL